MLNFIDLIKERKITMDKVTAKEINIDAGGYSFLCIFGKHYNIEFLEIPMGKADFIADKIAKTIRKKGYE